MSEENIALKNTQEIIQDSLSQAISYDQYRAMVANMAQEGKTTGQDQTEALINYTQLNDRRMKRFDKTVKIDAQTAALIEAYNRKVTWLVLTESWCGDAAPSMPVMNKMAELNEKIILKVILRDEHLDLMNRFLYKGTLSIPKLIMIDDASNTILGEWGPRPTIATKMVDEFKSEHGKLTPEFKQDLQVWYNTDKGQNILKDLTGLLLE